MNGTSGVLVKAATNPWAFTLNLLWDERCRPSHNPQTRTYLSNSALAESSMAWHTSSGVEVPA